MAIGVSDFCIRYPKLFHMAHRDSWASIRDHGLLSTRALLDLFEIRGRYADDIMSAHRAESIEITHPVLGSATIRDQKPMSDSGLERALSDDLTPADWYRILNGMVFFWPSEERLQRMMKALPYRRQEHIVLVASSNDLLRAEHDRVVLSPLNSGATRPFPHPRGRGTFQPMDSHPYSERRRRGLDPVAEVAIKHGVANIERYLLRVEQGSAGQRRRVIWTPEGPPSTVAGEPLRTRRQPDLP